MLPEKRPERLVPTPGFLCKLISVFVSVLSDAVENLHHSRSRELLFVHLLKRFTFHCPHRIRKPLNSCHQLLQRGLVSKWP